MLPSSFFILFLAVITPITAFFICPYPYGYFANPYSPYLFILCSNYVPYGQACPGGTVWYQAYQRCDYPGFFGVPAPPTTGTTPRTTITTKSTVTTSTMRLTTTTAPTTTTTSITSTEEVVINLCDKENPCQNGGSCQPLGKVDFFCLCTKDYYGSRCEHTGETTDLSLLESIINGNNNNYEHTVENVLNRHNWTNILAIVDVTGSMQPCAASIYRWMASSVDQNVRFYVFFNDGDDKPNEDKVIGSTGGVYGISANNPHKVLATMQTAMKNGDGGDIPENDIEAILRGIEMCPQCETIVHIADNVATPRDMILLSKVTKPIRVLTCRVDRAGVNPHLLNIADKTNGSLHTIDEDVTDLSSLSVNEKISIGQRTYRRTTAGFVLA